MRNTTQTPMKPTTGGAGFFDSPALSRDARPAPEEAVPVAGKSTRRRAGRKGVDSPVLEHGRPVQRGDASPVRTTKEPVVRGKSVFDSPVSTRRTPTAPPQTTPSVSLKPNGRSVFDMPITASPSTETVKPKRKKAPGPGKKPRGQGKKVPDDVVGSDGDEPEAWYRRASLADVLDELSSRFISNLSQEELASPERVCFQIEQAHWFYEDFIREAQPTLPTYRLKDFCKIFFAHSPVLSAQWGSDAQSERAFERFLVYKKRVPVCGAIMLNADWTKCVLVKGWKSGSSWGFPKGKMNNDEPKHLCAIREVEEETGYNCGALLNEQDYIQCDMNDQVITLFIVTGVPEDTAFAPQTRKEISAIEWFDLQDLPTWYRRRTQQSRPAKFFMITPFVAPLKEWMRHVMDVQGGSSSETDEAIDEVVHVDPAHAHEPEHAEVNLSPGAAPRPQDAPQQQEAITANINGNPSVLDDLFSKFTVASEKKEAKHGEETRQRAEESKADPAMQVLLEKLMSGRRGETTPVPPKDVEERKEEPVDSKQGKQQALMEKLMSSLGTPVKSPLPTSSQHTPMQSTQHLQSNGQLLGTPSKETASQFGLTEPHPHHPYSAINDGGFPMPTHNPALAALNGHVHPTMPHQTAHQTHGAFPPAPHFGHTTGQPQAVISHMTANLLNVLAPSRSGDGPVYPSHQTYASPSYAGPGQQAPPSMTHYPNSMSYGQSVPPPMATNQHQPPQSSLLGMLSSPQPSMAQTSIQSAPPTHPFNGPLPGPIQLPLQPGMPELNRILPYQALPVRAMEADVGYIMHNQPPPQFQQMHPSHALSPPQHPASTAQAHQLLALLNPREHVQTMTSPSTASAKTADGLLAMLVGNHRQGEGHG